MTALQGLRWALLLVAAGCSLGGRTVWASGPEASLCAVRPGNTGYSGMTSVFEKNDGEGRIRLVEITPGSPAEKAGLKAGDTVIKIDGHPLAFRSQYEWGHTYRAYRPGDVLVLTVLHEGGLHTVSLKLTEPTPEWTKRFLHWFMVEEVKAGGASSRVLNQHTANGPVNVTFRRDSSCLIQGEVAGEPADRPLSLAAALRIVPLLDRLRPGDSVTLRVSTSGNARSIDPIELPGYMGVFDVLRAVQETEKLRQAHAY